MTSNGIQTSYLLHACTHTFHSSIHAPVVAGLTTSVEIDLIIANLMDPAFNAILSFTAPSRLLTLTNAFNKTRNGEVCYHIYIILLQWTQFCHSSLNLIVRTVKRELCNSFRYLVISVEDAINLMHCHGYINYWRRCL